MFNVCRTFRNHHNAIPRACVTLRVPLRELEVVHARLPHSRDLDLMRRWQLANFDVTSDQDLSAVQRVAALQEQPPGRRRLYHDCDRPTGAGADCAG